MHITGILFDYDGTLVDSIPAHKKTIRKVARKHGIIITDEAFSRYNGMSTKRGFRKIMQEHHVYLGAVKIALELIKAKKNLLNEINMFPETKATLERLNNKYSMAVATSSNKNYLEKTVDRFNLRPYFQALLSANDIKHSKPSPEIFIKAAKRINKQPHECVVIEDSLNGIIAGKRGGMATIALLTTTKKELFVGEATPDLFIKDIAALTTKKIEQAWSKAHIRRQVEEEHGIYQ